jgi:tryptophan halogenase
MIQSVIVLGGGSAGLMSALAVKRHLPQLNVQVVRSKEIGVIGVGESTTPQFPQFIFEYLGISRKRFYDLAKPTWKTGIHYLWGPRPVFEFPFDFQLDGQWSDLPRPNGFYCDQRFENVNLNTALMRQGKVFASQPNGGGPVIGNFAAFHLFNPWLVSTLETIAAERGIPIIDAKLEGLQLGEKGVESIKLHDGRVMQADFFIDASGFKSELLGAAMGTEFVSFNNALFCDRAIAGTWDRTTEPTNPYTIAETMDAGWCWQVDHEHAINRGYVYSSRFISDEAAREEFVRKNPKVRPWDHVVKFRCGRYAKGWVKNVFGIGNACGFVEPLEATALMVASSPLQTMISIMQQSMCDPQPTMIAMYNNLFGEMWDNIRDFLAIHYKFNTRIKSEFWTTCWHETDVSSVKPLLDFYAENGPTGLARHLLNSPLGGNTQFGIEGWLVMLVGQKVPYRISQPISDQERAIFHRHCEANRLQASRGMTVDEALKFIKHPDWTWFGDPS